MTHKDSGMHLNNKTKKPLLSSLILYPNMSVCIVVAVSVSYDWYDNLKNVWMILFICNNLVWNVCFTY